jgi:hypothetical protein
MKNITLAALCLAVGTASATIFACAPSTPYMAPIGSASPAMMHPSMAPEMTSPTATPAPGATAAPATTPSAVASGTSNFKQIERLGRPAINEGLITQDALLNLWNSVGPSVDATSAAAPIAAEATKTLKALGNTDAQVAKLFGALLPDVMRIDTTHKSGYAGFAGNAFGNVEPTKGIPIGGRMITDDVIDVTLFLIVPDATNAAVPGLRSDNVGYDTPDANGHTHRPVMAQFPYAPTPN